ncbi:MAG: adenylate/guanylate cyclase domain-containing protein [bacterium]
MSIRTKLILVILPLIIVPLVYVGVTSYMSARLGISKSASKLLAVDANKMLDYVSRQNQILLDTGLIEDKAFVEAAKGSAEDQAREIVKDIESPTAYISVHDSQGVMIIHPEAKGENLADETFVKETFRRRDGVVAGRDSGWIEFTWRGRRRVGAFTYFQPWDWYILISDNDEAFYSNANNIGVQVAIIMGVTLPLAVVLVFLFVARLTRPLKRVVHTMQEIVKDRDLSKRVEVEYQDEIGELATWFNNMTEELEGAYNQIKQYAYETVLAKKSEERVRYVFQKYVPKEVIDEVLRHKTDKMLIGKNQEVTILFSDIRGFTTISERLKPVELVTSLNDYFTVMVDIIIKHGGVIDKFMGDAIMAIYGAPVKHDDDSLKTVLAGLDMVRSLEAFNRRQVELGRVEFKIGVGISTGEVVVGNIGSEQKMDYTVIGDAVNLASRLEGLTKEYGVPLIISEFTYEKIKDSEIKVRELDSVRVRGKIKPVKVYEVRGNGDLPEEEQRAMEIFRGGLELYKARSWDDALGAFRKVLSILPQDKPSRIYVERCQEFKRTPPPPDWDGVYVMQTK